MKERRCHHCGNVLSQLYDLPPRSYLDQWDERIVLLQRQVSLCRAALFDIANPPPAADALVFMKRRAEVALEIFKED